MRAILAALLMLVSLGHAHAEESKISVGPIDAWLTVPPNVEKPPVALLIAGSGSTDHDGNSLKLKPATLKKLSDALVARNIATLRYDKRGAGGWKKEFGKPEDFRFKDFVDDAASLIDYLRGSQKFSRLAVVGHSEGGLVAILAARRVPVDRLVLLAPAWVEHPEKLSGRKLFVTSRGDSLAAKIQEEYEKVPEPKKLLLIDGSAHAQFLFETEHGPRLLEEILRFLSEP